MSRHHLTVGQKEMAILTRSPVSPLHLALFNVGTPSIQGAPPSISACMETQNSLL